jgi:heptosyltransferase-1
VVLPWGSEPERLRSEALAARLPGAEVPDRRPLDEVARMLAGASLVVGLDTGLLHLAAALTVPVVGIFLGSDPALTAPRGAGPIAVAGRKGAPPSAEEVLDAIASVSTAPAG